MLAQRPSERNRSTQIKAGELASIVKLSTCFLPTMKMQLIVLSICWRGCAA